mmetsp:Transcript_47617/g.92964  ORF Transcript_47617/g.92964 Transcript_47617/m.92964 type:complete len:216 (-) Transcript_47617:848-1495(-)
MHAGSLRAHVPESLQLLSLVPLLQILRNSHRPVEKLGDLLEVVLEETSTGHGGRAHADAARGQGRGIARDGILVGGHACELEDTFDTGPVDTAGGFQIDEDQVVVGTARHERVSAGVEFVRERGGVFEHLLLVVLKFLGVGLFEACGQGTDGVVVRSALEAREHGEVDFLLQIVHDGLSLFGGAFLSLAEKDHGAAGPTERLVGGGGNDVRIGKR